jgi:glycosyltransferase involved in cell wall biosynthesis
MLPLVSCIMPTFDRRAFLPSALDYFFGQDYPDAELVIVDDGTDPVEDLVPCDPRVRYERCSTRLTVGQKRNLACELAAGSVIAHWDDDDWYAPHRLRAQVSVLLESARSVCGVASPLYFEPAAGRAWRFSYQGRPWVAGNSLCYRRDAWERLRFRHTNVGEDTTFVWRHPAHEVVTVPDPEIVVGVIHRHNISPKDTANRFWRPVPIERVRAVLGPDWDRYAGPEPPSASAAAPAGRVARSLPAPVSRQRAATRAVTSRRSRPRRAAMFTAARAADLQLPEFAAFCAGTDLPRMRRWELPFALFRSQLTDTMAVLDCTINPAGFGARLQALYPHVLYRHHNPVQQQGFVPLWGVPDAGFDRVICVNTLEHLLRPQREALVSDMARKLKPGGRLILTSDYFFPSSRTEAALVAGGVVRADGEEVFNGCNLITVREWRRLCASHGLHPQGTGQAADPSEDDHTLYRNVAPYGNACIGGVFVKGRAAPDRARRRVVLALLTWNTREVTLDSVQAHLAEARLLRRLGHDAFVCVCDNGSNDGTGAALRALDDGLDVEHAFILNQRNLGNSVARNQIIDYARSVKADYLLFMDGDIEIVPFSSVAMLRHLESNGSRAGCIGPHSWGQSNQRTRVSPSLYAVDPATVVTTNVVAWTQYGMFRMEMFESGVRFDERPPFDGPGWGFEDNDLAFQMDQQGYLCQYFSGITYLHRDPRSSIRIMANLGIDAHRLYGARKRYVSEKWRDVPEIARGPLAEVIRVNMP